MARRFAFPFAWLLLAAGVAGLMPADLPAQGKPFAQQAYEHMLTAIGVDSYEAFIEYGDPIFRSLRREEFDKVRAHFAPLLARGQRSTYLGSFRSDGLTIHYWRVTFNGERQDWLAKLAEHDRRVRGFFLSPP